jgi:hypothetical protein
LHVSTLQGAVVGAMLPDVYNGTGAGNFGWLTWRGSPNVPALARSLTPPGDSATYVNPTDADDHTVSVGDWVQGAPGVANGSPVREALDALLGRDITLPVWDVANGQGSTSAYRVTGFARVRLTAYRLPGQNRISARFLGFAQCGG